MFRIKAINDIYVDGEQYEELRQSIEERWVWMCLTILKLVRVLGIQRIRVGSAKCYGRGHNCRTPIKHLARLGCNFPARAWGDLVSELGTCTCESYADRQMCSSLGSAILLQLPPSGLSQHGQNIFWRMHVKFDGHIAVSTTEFEACYVFTDILKKSHEILNCMTRQWHDKPWNGIGYWSPIAGYNRFLLPFLYIFLSKDFLKSVMQGGGAPACAGSVSGSPMRTSQTEFLQSFSWAARGRGEAEPHFAAIFLPDRLIGCILSVLRSTRRIAHSAGRSGIFFAIAVAMEGGLIGAYLCCPKSWLSFTFSCSFGANQLESLGAKVMISSQKIASGDLMEKYPTKNKSRQPFQIPILASGAQPCA